MAVRSANERFLRRFVRSDAPPAPRATLCWPLTTGLCLPPLVAFPEVGGQIEVLAVDQRRFGVLEAAAVGAGPELEFPLAAAFLS